MKRARTGRYRGRTSTLIEIATAVLAVMTLLATAFAGPAHGAPTPPTATSFSETFGQCVPWPGHSVCSSTGTDQATFFGSHASGTGPLTFAVDSCTPAGQTDITYTNTPPSFITRSVLQAGTVVCTWHVTDSAGTPSAPATYTLTVTPPARPVVTDFSETFEQCVAWPGHTACSRTGIDQETFFGSHASGTGPLTYAIDSCTPAGETNITYTNSPAPSFITRSVSQSGTVVCTWHVTDGVGQTSDTATYTLVVTPPAKPVATSFSETGTQCVPGPMTACASTSMSVDDFFAPHATGAGQLSATVESCTPAGETDVTITPGTPTTITRSAGQVATVVCTWHVTDGVGQTSDPATYTLTISAAPGTPTVSDVHETQTINTDVQYDHALASGALPADGTLTFAVSACTYNGNPTAPSRDVGITTPRTMDGTVTVSLGSSGFTGTIDCLFTATSVTTGKTSAPAHFVVTVATPTPPTVSDVHKTQTVNTDVTYDSVLAEGAGPAGTKLGFDFGPCLYNGSTKTPSADVILTPTRGGTVTVQLAGSGFTGTIDCTFSATDIATGATSTPAHFVVTVPVPTPPTVGDVSVTQAYDTTATYPAALAAHLVNPAGGAVRFSLGTCSRSGIVSLTDVATGDVAVRLTGTHVVGSITCPFTVTDVNGRTASATFRVTTTHVPTRTALTSSRNPVIGGDPVTLTAAVTTTAGSAVTSGTVTFLDGATVLGTQPVTGGGVATLTTANLGGGTHHLVARYDGTATYDGSTSGPLDEVVYACTGNLESHVLTVTTSAGILRGIFCINPLLKTGTYTQLPFDGLPKLVAAAVVTITPQKVVLVANGLPLQLTALKSPSVNSFLETFPRRITGTFSLT